MCEFSNAFEHPLWIDCFVFVCLFTDTVLSHSPHWNFTLNIYANVHVNFYTARTTQSSEDAASRQRCDAHPNHWYANQERTTSFPSQMAKLHRTLHMQFKAEHSVRWQTSKRVTCRYCRIILSKSHCQMMYKKKKIKLTFAFGRSESMSKCSVCSCIITNRIIMVLYFKYETWHNYPVGKKSIFVICVY